MNPVRGWLVGILKRAYRVIPKIALEIWGEENIWIGSKESVDNPGPYKRHHAVYAARILDLFMNDPQWRTLLVMKSSQSGFTFHVLILICRRIAEIATSIIYVIDSLPKARDLSQTRLQPLLKDCKATKLDCVATEDAKLKTLVYDLPNAILRLAGSGSAGQVASFPADLVVGDELDKWLKAKGEAHKWYLLIQRIKRSEYGKAIGFSTPTTETAITNVCFQSGTQHRDFVPCPHCGYKQIIDRDRMRYEHCKQADGKTYDLERVLRETYMECANEECKGRIEEDHKLEMMLNAELRATNYKEIEVDGVLQMVPGWTPGEMSFHISDYYSMHPSSTWGVLMFEYIKAQGDPGEQHNFQNGREGLPIKQTVASITGKQVMRLRSGYKRGTLPGRVAIVTIQVDNQGDHQKWVLMGWMPNGDAYIIDWGKTLDRSEILDLCKKPILVPDRDVHALPELETKLVELFVQRGIMDEGGKDGTSYEVRNFCYPIFPFFFPCKGRGGVQVKNTIHFSDSSLSKGGEVKIPVCHFDDDAFKRLLYIDRIKKFDPEKSREFGQPRLHLPMNVDEALVRELCGEELVKELDANGVAQFVWKSKPPNDYGDGVKMGYVLWDTIAHEFRPV